MVEKFETSFCFYLRAFFSSFICEDYVQTQSHFLLEIFLP